MSYRSNQTHRGIWHPIDMLYSLFEIMCAVNTYMLQIHIFQTLPYLFVCCVCCCFVVNFIVLWGVV